MSDDEGAASSPTGAAALLQPPLRFSGIIASAGRLQAACLRQTLIPLAVLSLFLSLTPVLLALDAADNLLLPLAFLLIVVLPTVLFSFAFGVISVALDDLVEGHTPSFRRAYRTLAPRRRDVLVGALLAGMLSLTLAALLLPLWPLFKVLFFGPPVLVQVVALEGHDVRGGWPRLQALMRGHWARIIMCLIAVSLGIALLENTALGVAAQMLEDAPRAVALAILLPMQMLLVGFLYSFAAAVGYVCYYDVRARAEDGSAAVE
ncbi:MAG: hypothetical protein ACRDLB_01765 [Actinomycetota bacterium]